MASGFQNIGKIPELRRRILFTVTLLAVYRIGAFVTTPGVNRAIMGKIVNQASGTFLGLFNMFSGGALEQMSIFALGIMPYISASIILQLLTVVVPKLEQITKEGEMGQRKINQYTRYGCVILSLIQSFFIARWLEGNNRSYAQFGQVVTNPGWGFRLLTMVSLTTGTAFIMWLGEQITERGIGNGISLIIFAGIAAGLPRAVGGTLELTRTGAFSIPLVLVLFVGAILVTALVVFVESGQRRIPVHYAKRQVGRKVYAGQSSFLPLKLNISGVIPPIFASSLILFPATLAGWFGTHENATWLRDISAVLSPGQPIYVLLYASAIVFFCYFYTALVFSPKETAENLKKSGAFVPGIRPGEQTARYVEKIILRLTLVGAIYVTLVCLMPEFLIVKFNVPFYFGGTSLLIIVVVTMDFMAQVKAYVMSHQYESLLKKANFKGGSGGVIPTR
jgi:preprotein translocase subunit SecY